MWVVGFKENFGFKFAVVICQKKVSSNVLNKSDICKKNLSYKGRNKVTLILPLKFNPQQNLVWIYVLYRYFETW